MSDDTDSWLAGIGVNVQGFLGTVQAKATAAVAEVKSAGAAVVEQAKGAVNSAAKAAGVAPPVKPAAAPATKPAAPTGAPTTGGSALSLKGSVGAGGKNNPEDVKAVQTALKLTADGNCSPATIEAIKAFQKSIGHAKPDGRVDVGGATSKALAGRGGGAAAPPPAPAPNPAPAPAPAEEGFLDGLKKKVVAKLEEGAGAVKDLGGKVVEGAKKTLGDPNAASGAKPTVPQADGGFSKTLNDAIASFAPVLNIPGLGRFDMAANLNKAANQVVANNTQAKLPFLEEATELLANASLILDENRTSEVGAIPLPRPTAGFSGKCCSADELQKFRGAIEAPRNALQNAVNAYNDTQRAIEDAAEQGKKICYGGLAACIAGTVATKGAGTIPACLAGAIA
jgi:hypothetical protein